jgi:hypothetical protein
MEAAFSSETFVSIYKTTQCQHGHNPNLKKYNSDMLKTSGMIERSEKVRQTYFSILILFGKEAVGHTTSTKCELQKFEIRYDIKINTEETRYKC